jgi:hypothetical protein
VIFVLWLSRRLHLCIRSIVHPFAVAPVCKSTIAMIRAGARRYFAKTRPISEVKTAIRECKAKSAYE